MGIGPTNSLTLTAEEAGVVLGVCTRSIYDGCDDDRIPHRRVGRRIVISGWELAEAFAIPIEAIRECVASLRSSGA